MYWVHVHGFRHYARLCCRLFVCVSSVPLTIISLFRRQQTSSLARLVNWAVVLHAKKRIHTPRSLIPKTHVRCKCHSTSLLANSVAYSIMHLYSNILEHCVHGTHLRNMISSIVLTRFMQMLSSGNDRWLRHHWPNSPNTRTIPATPYHNSVVSKTRRHGSRLGIRFIVDRFRSCRHSSYSCICCSCDVSWLLRRRYFLHYLWLATNSPRRWRCHPDHFPIMMRARSAQRRMCLRKCGGHRRPQITEKPAAFAFGAACILDEDTPLYCHHQH